MPKNTRRLSLSHGSLGICCVLLAWFISAAGKCAVASDPKGIEFFEKKIRPVLVKHCYECHSAASKSVKGELRIDTAMGVQKGGVTGELLVPGNPQASLLIEALRHDGLEMPPGAKLPNAIIKDFEHWVSLGAPVPEGKRSEGISEAAGPRREQHWAFQLPHAHVAPAATRSDWPAGDIDRFVLAKMEQRQLSPVADADRRTLVRRVYFDVIGLPPPPAEVEQFVAGDSADAWVQLVDRLLASPAYGERWGRHWLDVARYADTNGRDQDVIYPQAWRYREYVIDAFNEDKPFNRFVVEQVAGDLLPSTTATGRDQLLVATGFLALGAKYMEEPNYEQFLLDMADEQMDVITRSVLALTVTCARCHDHKFDPIPTSEYYALAGIFRSTETLFGIGLPGHPRNTSALQPIGEGAEILEGPAVTYRARVAKAWKAVLTARSDRYRVVKQLASMKTELAKEAEAKRKAEGDETASVEATPTADKSKAEKPEKTAAELELEAKIAEWDEIVKALTEAHTQLVSTPPPFPAYALAARDCAAPEDCKIRIRGDVAREGDPAPRGVLTSLNRPHFSEIPTGQSGRLQFAEWMTAAENPLVARVAVNRVWMYLFGRGLVASVDNFGINGEAPSHPELLDTLAVQFMADGWSTKRLIRSLLLSRTYRLSNDYNAHNYASDPDSIYLWRMRRRTLDVEAFRDAVLSASGVLDANPPESGTFANFKDGSVVGDFGDRVRPEKFLVDEPHRSIYLPVSRTSLPEMFKLFDFADPSIVSGQRSERTVPAQSLFLMNSPFISQQAESLATRLLAMNLPDDVARVGEAYRLCLSREPNDREVERAEQFIRAELQRLVDAGTSPHDCQKQALGLFCQTLFACAEFRGID